MVKKNEDLNKLKKWFDSLSEERKNEIHQAVKLTYNSCAIEGNTLSENQVFNLIIREMYYKENQI